MDVSPSKHLTIFKYCSYCLSKQHNMTHRSSLAPPTLPSPNKSLIGNLMHFLLLCYLEWYINYCCKLTQSQQQEPAQCKQLETILIWQTTESGTKLKLNIIKLESNQRLVIQVQNLSFWVFVFSMLSNQSNVKTLGLMSCKLAPQNMSSSVKFGCIVWKTSKLHRR